MNVGLGLPISDPEVLLDWAQRADAGPFSTLGLLDRFVYDNPEPLVTLAALAGATPSPPLTLANRLGPQSDLRRREASRNPVIVGRATRRAGSRVEG